MLDSFISEIEFPHKPFGEEQVFKKSGGSDKSFRQRTPIPGTYTWSMVYARSRRNGNLIRLEGSAASFLQGHNLFGTNNVFGLLFTCYARVLTHLGIRFTERRLEQAVARGRIKRLDLAGSIQLPRGVKTLDVIQGLREGLANAPGHVRFYGTETTLEPGGGAPSRTFYDKEAKELKRVAKKWAAHKFCGEQYLRKKLKGLLRFEVRLPEVWLSRNQLGTPGDWTEERARKILREQLVVGFARCAVIRKDEPQIIDLMRNVEKIDFLLWLHGEDLHRWRSRRTLVSRHKRFLRKYGIDLRSRPPRSFTERVALSKVLDASQLWLGYPSGARKLGIIALPSQCAITSSP